MDKSYSFEMNSLPKPNLVEPTTQHGHQDGQTTHDMAALPGPLAVQMTEPSDTVCQSWRDIASKTGLYSSSASYESEARMNQSVNHGHGNSIPQQEWGLVDGFPTTRSRNYLIYDNEPGDLGCFQTALKGLRLIQQKLTQLVTKMMGTNEEQMSRGPNVDVGRNPNIGFVCNSRVQITCCHVVCLPFNDGRCQVYKEPVEDSVDHL